MVVLRNVSRYGGVEVPALHRVVGVGDTVEVGDDIAASLVASGAFERATQTSDAQPEPDQQEPASIQDNETAEAAPEQEVSSDDHAA